MKQRSWIEINLGVFRSNLHQIKKLLGNKKYCLPIKANAYGHGIVPISRIAQEVGVDYLAVASLEEGKKLREAQISLPILVLGAFQKGEVVEMAHLNLEPTISSFLKAELIEEAVTKASVPIKVHLKVDTGMRRIGPRPETAKLLYKKVVESKKMKLVGIFSHLAMASDKNHPFNKVQEQTFKSVLNQIDTENLLIHLSNSEGIIHFNFAFENMARVGLLSFGVHQKKEALFSNIKPFFTLKSRVAYFKVVEKGDGVGYGHTYSPNKRTRIVTVSLGYGDGYLRALSNKGSVLIRGSKYPIVGNICMDQLMVDIGDGEAYVGDEVVLVGRQGQEEISLQELSADAKTIPYEILCHFNERLPRIYEDQKVNLSQLS